LFHIFASSLPPSFFFFVYFEFNLSILLIPNFFFVYRRPDGSFFFLKCFILLITSHFPLLLISSLHADPSARTNHITHYTVRRRMINRVFGMLFIKMCIVIIVKLLVSFAFLLLYSFCFSPFLNFIQLF
jgi:hypothetical protein